MLKFKTGRDRWPIATVRVEHHVTVPDAAGAWCADHLTPKDTLPETKRAVDDAVRRVFRQNPQAAYYALDHASQEHYDAVRQRVAELFGVTEQ